MPVEYQFVDVVFHELRVLTGEQLDSSAWGFEYGALYGAGTAWPAIDTETGARAEIAVGDHDTWETLARRLWKQLESTSTWPAWALTLGDLFADIEIVQGQLDERTKVADADGVWLDEIGVALGRTRGGQTDDDDYRLALIAEALSQVTSGAPDEIIDVAIRLAGADPLVTYREPGPATFELQIPDLPAGRFALMLEVMADMPPAGVGAWLTTWTTASTGGWSYTPSPPDDPARWGFTGSAVGRSQWSYTRRLGT